MDLERLLNAPPRETTTTTHRPRMVFTSGGTESVRSDARTRRSVPNNLVLQGWPWNFIVTTATEHSSVHITTQFLATHRGRHILYAPVDALGRVDAEALVRLVQEQPPGPHGTRLPDAGEQRDWGPVAGDDRRDPPPLPPSRTWPGW